MPSPPQPPAAGRSIAVVVAAIVAVVAVVFVVVRLGGAGQSGGAAVPALTSVDIVTIPVGALVVRADDGGVLGQGPLTLSLPKSDVDLRVVVKADGFQDRRVNVPLFSESGRVDVTLTAIGAEPPPVPRPPPDGWTP